MLFSVFNALGPSSIPTRNPCYFELVYFLFQESYFCFVFFFCATVLKFVNDFSKGAICGMPSTSGSYQNYYQGNVYVYF